MRKRLTDRVVRGLTTDKPQEDVWDSTFTGASFGVRVSNAGRKTFVLLYRHGSRLTRKTLGLYPHLSLADARRRALEDVGQLAKGGEPKRRNDEPTFGDLAEDFILKYPQQAGLRPLTVKQYCRILKRDLLPAWRDRPVKAISRIDVNALLDELAYGKRKAPVMANRTLALASVLFNYAVDKGRWNIDANPCYRLKRRVKERPRDRFLNDDEIRALWQALHTRQESIRSIYKLILLTAQRSGEVKAMRWDQVEADVWTIPREITKNRKTHRVPLSGPVVELLESIRKETGWSEWVFPSREGGHIDSLDKNSARIQKAVGFHFTPHDLRRTAATQMAKLRIEDSTIGRVLNHSWATANITNQVYALDDRLDEKRQALERWAARLEQIVSGEPAKVVKIR